MEKTLSTQHPRPVVWRQWGMVILAVVAWSVAYNVIQSTANWLTYTVLKLPEGSHLGESLAFFFYDVPKILLLLSGMVFLISVIRTFFSPERTRAMLGGKRLGIGNGLAALLGIVTPFCSCSAVPLFIGFVESGIPLGVTFSFLIAAPTISSSRKGLNMVNLVPTKETNANVQAQRQDYPNNSFRASPEGVCRSDW